MKWLCVPVVLFPYSVLGVLYCLFTGALMESVFQNNGLFCVAFLFLWMLLGFACAVWVGIRGTRTLDCRRLARIVMVIKLAQIPAYCAIFVLAALFTLTIFTFGFTIALAFFDAMAIGMTGILGAFCVRKCCRYGLLAPSDGLVHGLLQFIFCLDVISSIWVYFKTKQKKSAG